MLVLCNFWYLKIHSLLNHVWGLLYIENTSFNTEHFYLSRPCSTARAGSNNYKVEKNQFYVPQLEHVRPQNDPSSLLYKNDFKPSIFDWLFLSLGAIFVKFEGNVKKGSRMLTSEATPMKWCERFFSPEWLFKNLPKLVSLHWKHKINDKKN